MSSLFNAKELMSLQPRLASAPGGESLLAELNGIRERFYSYSVPVVVSLPPLCPSLSRPPNWARGEDIACRSSVLDGTRSEIRLTGISSGNNPGFPQRRADYYKFVFYKHVYEQLQELSAIC